MFVALLLAGLLQSSAPATPVGNPEAGKAYWERPRTFCTRCHGKNGEGAFGPDLAGRQLTFSQFRRAVRKPWGVMPAWNERQLTDQTIADLAAYFRGLPPVEQPGPWNVTLPAGARHGQQLAIETIGCAQCHGPELAIPRRAAGGVAGDFAWLQKMVYEHTEEFPEGIMGTYSRSRLQESLLREVWHWASVELGLRVPVRGVVNTIAPSQGNTTYTFTVDNEGTPGKGLTAEDITVSLTLAPGWTIVSATGPGYQGGRRDAEANADVAVWKLAKLGPAEKQAYTITVAGSGSVPGVSKGVLTWTKPALPIGVADTQPMVLTPPPPKQ